MMSRRVDKKLEEYKNFHNPHICYATMVELFGPSINQKNLLDKMLYTYFQISSKHYTENELVKIIFFIIDDYTCHDLCDELQQLKTSETFFLLESQLSNKFNTINYNGQKTFVQSFSPIKLIYLAMFELVQVLNQI